jgi:putative transposase
MTRFICFALIMSALRNDIQVHAFCAMPTHLHYVVTDPNGKLPRFLEMFHRLVALGVKIIRKWDGAVWDRAQTRVVELDTRQAIVDKIAYTLANPVAANLVCHAHQWPGVRTLVRDIGQRVIHARRPDVYFSPKNSDWVLNAAIDISIPPTIPEGGVKAFRDDITRALNELEAAARARNSTRVVLGAKRAASVSPESRITIDEIEGQCNPTFAIGRGNVSGANTVVNVACDFRTAYRNALDAWRAGNRSVEFPAGTYAMRVFHGANVASRRG